MEKYVVLFGKGLKKEEELRNKGIIGLPAYSGPYSSFNRENPRDRRIIEVVSDVNLSQHEMILDVKLINENELKKTLQNNLYHRVYSL